MNGAISVNDTKSWIVMHSCRANVMANTARTGKNLRFLLRQVRQHPTESTSPYLTSYALMSVLNSKFVDLGQTPIDGGNRYAKNILLIGQRYAALGVRCLFDVVDKLIPMRRTAR